MTDLVARRRDMAERVERALRRIGACRDGKEKAMAALYVHGCNKPSDIWLRCDSALMMLWLLRHPRISTRQLNGYEGVIMREFERIQPLNLSYARYEDETDADNVESEKTHHPFRQGMRIVYYSLMHDRNERACRILRQTVALRYRKDRNSVVFWFVPTKQTIAIKEGRIDNPWVQL